MKINKQLVVGQCLSGIQCDIVYLKVHKTSVFTYYKVIYLSS